MVDRFTPFEQDLLNLNLLQQMGLVRRWPESTCDWFITSRPRKFKSRPWETDLYDNLCAIPIPSSKASLRMFLETLSEEYRPELPVAISSIEPTPFIETLNEDQDENQRATAARILGMIKSPEAVPSLIKAMEDTDAGVRSLAASALGQIGQKESVDQLIAVLEGDDETRVRCAAAEALGRLGDPKAIEPLVKVLSNKEETPQLRSFAAEALGKIGHTNAVPALVRASAGDEKRFVRVSAVEALGKIGALEALPILKTALDQDKDKVPTLRLAAIGAMAKIGHVDATASIGRALKGDKITDVRIVAAQALGGMRHADGIPWLAEALNEDSDDEVRRAAVEALGEISQVNPRAIEILGKSLIAKDTKSKLRVAIISSLADNTPAGAIEWIGRALNEADDLEVRKTAISAFEKIEQVEAIPLLVKALIHEKDSKLREELAYIIEISKAADWREKTDQVIQALQKSRHHRESIEAAIILQVIRPPEEQFATDRYLLTDYLISQAVGKDERMTGILAQVIIESAGRSLKLAGERVNEYQEANNPPDSTLQRLRIEIGGETALDPIIKELRTNLQENFQEPIKALNADTHKMWQATIRDARYGFTARMILSVVVFVVGIVLLAISSGRMIFGNLKLEQFFGSGVSFASGLAMMLLTIYVGPLKEIRQSVSDLGVASAAFIAYVHRVLEISHTFSFYYLKERISFEEMKCSSDLIGVAMAETVGALHQGDTKSVEETIRRAITAISPSSASSGKE